MIELHLSGDSQMFDIPQYISDEVDLELAIRERLATTVQGRIEWALRMLDALSNTKESQDQPPDADDFQDAALDAFDTLEVPTSFIFDTPLPEERSPSPTISPIVPSQPAPQRAPKTRSTRTPKPSQTKKHLYIRLPPSASHSQLAILACPICSKKQFTTLQGLFNHARLAHDIEWASHDACIAACALPVPDDVQNWEMYEKDGVEVPWGGNVVGLRRLFERAVGVDGTLLTPSLAHIESDAPLQSPATAPSTLLSQTLGLHADSPALAQFLGRTPKRRCIHVHDEEQAVDIISLECNSSHRLASGEPGKPKQGFHMHYPHRNTTRQDLDLAGIDMEAETTNPITTAPAIALAGTSASRFHITARIRLEDRSLFLKEDQRIQLGTTDQYRWMLGVTAPSYSLSLSSFLTCVTVIPPRTVSPVFLTVQQQPFAVVSTANEPFMAKVVLEWVGGGKMELEHWIELDQSKSSTSVFGSEQLFDVELDRNTPLLPAQKGAPPLPSLDHKFASGALPHNIFQADPERGNIPTLTEEYYEQILRSLLPRVPMTAKDFRPRMAIQVPYRLAASSTHLLSLVPGRRKAIEWARARALHALYVEHMASASPSRRTFLTVGDVYMFLEDDAHFPRPSNITSGLPPEPKKKGREKDGTPILGEDFCPSCGIKKRLHTGYDVKHEEDAVQWTCAVVPTSEQRYGTRLPLVNLTKVLPAPDGLKQVSRGPSSAGFVPCQAMKTFLTPCPHSSRDLVNLSPPELIFAVHSIVSKLRFPAFPRIGGNRAYLPSREHIEECLAPAALLSLTLKPFISTLLLSAIEIAKRDVTSITPTAKSGRGKRMKKLSFVLSPGHVLRGLRHQPSDSHKTISTSSTPRTTTNAHHWETEVKSLCLAQFGVRLDTVSDALGGLGTNNTGHLIGHPTIKVEPT